MRSAIGPVLLMLGAFAALEISESSTGRDSGLRKLQAKAIPPPEPIELPGLENFHRLAPGLYSGGQPGGEPSFEALAKLGLKTIISVDGANPDAEMARKHGLRTIHLPVGYNGIDSAQSARLIKAARMFPGPMLIHCRKGKHRGPAAAALVGMAVEGWSTDQALAWLKKAGTSPEYSGLFATLKTFRVPNDAELTVVPNDWPETTEIPSLTQAMIELEADWERLQSNPSSLEAHKLSEHYRKLGQGEQGASRCEDFQTRLAEAVKNAQDLAESLEKKPSSQDESESIKLVERTRRDCKACHEAHRN